MADSDSLIIPPFKGKRESSIGEAVNVKPNNMAAAKQNANRLTMVYYPYRKILFWSQMLQLLATFFCMLFIYLSIEEGKNIIPRNFYDPCYASNVMPLNEVDEMKKNIADINVQKQSFAYVLGHNISTYTNEYLKEKLANLTTASDNLKKQYEEQKEIRYICYKQNLEERCEGYFSTTFQKLSKFIYIYIGIVIVYALIARWCIKKVKKRFEEMKLMDNNEMFNSAMITVPMIFIVLFNTINSIGGARNSHCFLDQKLKEFYL